MCSLSMPGSRGAWRSASAIEPRFGCEVRPLIESMAPSTASAPGLDRGEHAGGGDAAGVVSVEVHRQSGLLA